MSSVDQGKAEALVQSLANTFSRFDGGGASFGDGNMISNGTNQLSQLDNYFNSMGQMDDGDSTKNPNEDDNNGESSQLNPSISPLPTPTQTPEEVIKGENKAESEILYDEIKDIALKYSIDDYVEIAIDAEQYRYIAIEIKGSVLFQLGKAELKEEAKPLMSKVADMLKEYSGYRIEVIGHTDNVPCTSAPYYSNEMLSAARAINVARYMAETKEIGWENVFYSGRGEYEPIASNDTEEGRRKNRRVEIRLYNKKNSTN